MVSLVEMMTLSISFCVGLGGALLTSERYVLGVSSGSGGNTYLGGGSDPERSRVICKTLIWCMTLFS